MPGNSDKSSEKPKPVQTVQTLLAAKNGNEKQKKKTPKRPNIEVSMDSSSDLTIELTNFQNDLDIIKDSLEGVVTKTDLDKSLADIVKKSDLETVVTSIVTKLLDSFKKEINEKISEKSNKQTKAIENLTKENEELREQIAGQRKIVLYNILDKYISYFFVFILRIVHDFDVKFSGVLLVIIRHL
jgi:hypothetical protein